MEEVRRGEGKVRGGGKEQEARRAGRNRGSTQRWGLPPSLELPAEGWRAYRNGGGRVGGGISRTPHDLFRPGGTCASQPLMAAITLPTYWCLNQENKRQTRGKRGN